MYVERNGLCTFAFIFLICLALEDAEEDWGGERGREGKSRRMREQTIPLSPGRFLAPMSDMSWIEGRNFKLDVRFKFAFRLELSIAPNGTVLISETAQGLEICFGEITKA